MKHLTYTERKKIEELLLEKRTRRDIGRHLARDHTVISRETNRYQLAYPHDGFYKAEKAQLLFEKNLKGKRQSKIEQYPLLKQYVVENLREEKSPEMIAGRLKNYEKRRIGTSVSHEIIYQFIYSREGRALKLPQHLFTRRGKRYSWYKRSNPIRIPERISIHDRPRMIEKRRNIGHWESDLMIYPQQKSCLSVEAERKSRYISLHKIPNKTAESKLTAMEKTIDEVSQEKVQSITFDNGTENVKHIQLRKRGIQTFFCDAYKSWQKGTVENMNKWIRWYFPRDYDMENIPESVIQNVQERLNNKPRKCLNYLTPKEVFLMGGALNT